MNKVVFYPDKLQKEKLQIHSANIFRIQGRILYEIFKKGCKKTTTGNPGNIFVKYPSTFVH